MLLSSNFQNEEKEIYTHESLYFYPKEELYKISTSSSSTQSDEISQNYFVEKIIDYSHDDDEKVHYYFIKWLNYPNNFNTWEPESNLIGCEKKIEEYHKNSKKKKLFQSYKKDEVYQIITYPEYKEILLKSQIQIDYPCNYSNDLILYYPYKIYNKKENVKRDIRFLKIKIKDKEKIYVTHDLFHIIKSKTNFSREIRSYKTSSNNVDILKLKVPDLNHNKFLGQIQFVVSLEIVNKFVEKTYSKELEDYFNWIYDEIYPFMNQ